MRRIPLPRRLAVLVLAPLLALSATAATAQGVWVTAPDMPTARANLASAAAKCPEGLLGSCVYAVGGTVTSGGGATGIDKFEAYSPASGTWATLPVLKTPRYGLAATTAPCPAGVKGDCVYALGGFGATAVAVDTVEAYSTETNAWLTLKPLPTKRGNLAAATAPCPDGLGLRGVCVFAFGGYDGSSTAVVEAYSPATNTWATVTPLQVARNGHGGAAAPCPARSDFQGTCVYAVSGTTTDVPLPSVEVYSPALNAWQYAADIPTPRSGFGSAAAPCPEGVSDGCVYAVGASGTGTVEAYTPATNVWVTLPTLPTERFGLASATAHCPKNRHSDCVYAVGGLHPEVLATTEAFAIERGPDQPKPDAKPGPKPDAKPSGPPAGDAPQEPDWSNAPEAEPQP